MNRPFASLATVQEVSSRYPKPLSIAGARRKIRDLHRRQGDLLVVLDDDPTGTQTVHDIDVFLEWDGPLLEQAFRETPGAFYLSTNSRSLATSRASDLARDLGTSLRQAGDRVGRRFSVASRSDSTLRGHFPQEVDCLLAGLNREVDGILLCPAFFEGGRYTLEDTHFVAGSSGLVPAGETEFARDPHFGYKASNLREWVAEKTHGRVRPEEVASLDLNLLREGGPGEVAAFFHRAENSQYIVLNALEDSDLEVAALGLLEAEAEGKRFVYRCAASWVKVYAGIEDLPLLEACDLGVDGPGLVVVGSYVGKTGAQVARLLSATALAAIEAPVDLLADEKESPATIESLVDRVDAALGQGKTAVLFTTREKKNLSDEEFLDFGEKVMRGLTAIVRALHHTPGYVLSKGGITSLSIAKDGLGMKQARVRGQIAAGVPVWEPAGGSKWEGLPYIVFPGNVGTPETLRDIVTDLDRSSTRKRNRP